MILSFENIFLAGSVLLFISILASKPGARVGIPVLLLFLIVGMLAGTDGLGINFSDPHYAQFIGNMALVIILFSGGMDTKFTEVRRIIGAGTILATVGVFLTAVITGLFIWWIMHYKDLSGYANILDALLLGAVMSSTDSASVFGILRGKGIDIKHRIKSLLEFESGSNDPMAYMMTLILIQLILGSKQLSAGEIFLDLGMQLIIGIGCGYILGKLTVLLINRINLYNHSLYAVLLLSCAFFIFAFTNTIKGNGFMGVYIAGLVIGNHKFVHRKSISNFIEGLAWLFQIIMFLALGLLVNPHEILGILWVGLAIGLFLIFIARPVVVLLCLSYTRKINFKGKLFISWVGLRGAVPIIFATYPLTAGLPGAQIIFNIVFFITLLSLLLQGTTIPWMARILDQMSDQAEEAKTFNINVPDDMKGAMTELEINEKALQNGNLLMHLPLADNILIVLIKRNNNYLVPKGNTILKPGDKLLLISDDENSLKQVFRKLGVTEDQVHYD